VKANSAEVPGRSPDAAPPLDALVAASQSALSLQELLPSLASCWCEQFAAGVVVIGVRTTDSDEMIVFRGDPAAVTRLKAALPETDLSEDNGLQQQLIDAANAGDPALWIPLADSGSVVGGVLLYSDQGRALFPVPPAWMTATARLVSRARDFEWRLRNDKLEALAEFAAGAGHEINNPLGSIIISAEKLLKDESDPERRRLLSTIGGEAYRARDMISDAMTFARPPRPQQEDLDLANQVDEVLTRFAEPIQQRRITLERQLTRPTAIHADRTQLAAVISELLRNALNAVDDEGKISCGCRPADETGDALLTLADDGHGLNEQQRAHLFDPFYSGRQAGRGLGFGLSKAWRIITNHGGRIAVRENEPRGLTFTVRWPAYNR
jgi:signal transduction histidine kinase